MLFPVTDGLTVSFKELPVAVILSAAALRGSFCGSANNVRALELSKAHLIL